MINTYLKYFHFLLLLVPSLFACNHEKEGLLKDEEFHTGSGLYVASLSNSETSSGELSDNTTVITDILDDEFINDYSLIYISQRGPNNIEPEFDNIDSENLYIYMYYDNPAANWDGGYNFASVGSKELDWDYIRNVVGAINNTYIFFSLYFPEDNKVRFQVNKDQSVLEKLKQSNILGARHTTDQLNSRLRFRFYHLMAFLNVDLYVPVFDADDNSGFLDNSLLEGCVLNINRFFQIDYSSDPGADQSPHVALQKDSPLEDILMYIHPGSEETNINVKDYYPNGEQTTDKVRKYTLSVLFPEGQDITDRELLRFNLKQPGGTVKKYLFKTNQSIALSLKKGYVSQLGLYLPRHQNNTILINSNILDWKSSSSEMNLMEEE